MINITLTIDIDWASEYAIAYTIDYFLSKNIAINIFSTHDSRCIQEHLDILDVGLHPYFGQHSSHGDTIDDVVQHIINLPHNIKAFRCHRFLNCNESLMAMKEIGMQLTSNICTDLQYIQPFRHRSGMIEMPIYMEDGSYLLNQHSLDKIDNLIEHIHENMNIVILIHPMHLVCNTPNFEYMKSIKMQYNREEWNTLGSQVINRLSYYGNGIRTMLDMLIQHVSNSRRLSDYINASLA